MTAVKICGLTRAADAECAASLGAAYLGCVFAGGPRTRTPADAAVIFAGIGRPPGQADRPRRVGVFGAGDAATVVAAARTAALDVLQLHGPADPGAVVALRARIECEIWAVVRCTGGTLPPETSRLWGVADGVLLDAVRPGRLGGTGVVLPWAELAPQIAALRDRPSRATRLVLAGGLTPENVGTAIAALRPDVVDVSSGVEVGTPGVKDTGRMRAFIEAVGIADRAVARPSPFVARP